MTRFKVVKNYNVDILSEQVNVLLSNGWKIIATDAAGTDRWTTAFVFLTLEDE